MELGGHQAVPPPAGIQINPTKQLHEGAGQVTDTGNSTTDNAEQFWAGTYVVQVPKDQIYRVPPQANASFVRRVQNPKRHRKSPCRRYCCCVMAYLTFCTILFMLIVTVAAGLFYIVFRPQLPDFTVEKFIVKTDNATKTPPHGGLVTSSTPHYYMTIAVRNPDAGGLGFAFDAGGKVGLYYSETQFAADGEFPAVEVGPGGSEKVRVLMPGSQVAVVDDVVVRKGLKAAAKRGRIPVEVTVEGLPVRVRLGGGVESWTWIMNIACHVEVNKLDVDGKVMSQWCNDKGRWS